MNRLKIALIGFLGTALSACVRSDNVRSVNADEFEKKIKASNVQLVDVRTAEEYAGGRISDAVNIDIRQPGFAEKAAGVLKKNRAVYVYCRSGKRSMAAANALADKGYKLVNLKGGIMEWQAKGKPVVKP